MSSSEVRMVKLKSSDQVIFEVEGKVLSLSKTLKPLIEDGIANDGKPIPLENVSSDILSKVIEYCRMHVEKGDSIVAEEEKKLLEWEAEFVHYDDYVPIFRLIQAANYLEIEKLLQLTCQAAADMFKDKTVEEVREIFGIENDFTKEEEAQLRRENAWAFD